MKSRDPFGLVGKTIGGKYAVEAVVDEGGFSVVYRATHLLWNRPVAIKAFKTGEGLSEDARAKMLRSFLQEGALLAELSTRCAAICQARDVSTVTTASGEWVPYMVLEWLEGETLEAALWRERERGDLPRSLPEAMRLLAPIADALAVVHAHGVAHRDVKPGNILLLRAGQRENAPELVTAKLLDFGIAKVLRSALSSGRGLRESAAFEALPHPFTPSNGAPEQFSTSLGPTGPWTDVFALALIVVELVSGTEALIGDDLKELARQSSNSRVRPTPRARGIDVGEDAEAVLACALAVEPMQRFTSAGAFWRALSIAAAKAPQVSALPVAHESAPPVVAPASVPTLLDPRRRVTRRPRMRIAAVVAAALATAAGAALAALPRHTALPTVEAAPALAAQAAGPTAPPQAASDTEGQSEAPSLEEPLTPRTSPAADARCPPNMRFVPGGDFVMGADEGAAAARPAHTVSVAPFCIDALEVATADYAACVDRGACERAPSENSWTNISTRERTLFDPLCNAREPAARALHPINCVDWSMAEAYCASQGARLPTEAEWEFSARGPRGHKYPWGDEEPTPLRLNACGKECAAWGARKGAHERALYLGDDGYATTAPVGSFPAGASPFGVQDLAGNVWEWTSGRFEPYVARSEEGSAEESDGGGPRVIRGGAWNAGYAGWLSGTFRHGVDAEVRSYAVGFRCARAPSGEGK